MNDRPDNLTGAEAETGRWLPLAEAAGPLGARTAEALRQRIRRDRTRYRWRKSDRGDLLVWVDQPEVRSVVHPAGRTDATAQPDQPTGQPDTSVTALLAERDSEIATLKGRLAALEGERAELVALRERAAVLNAELAALRVEAGQTALRLAERDARIEDMTAERDRLLALLESALAERRERRPWPGLRRWLRRVWEGEG
jgi:hypothetical protein